MSNDRQSAWRRYRDFLRRHDSDDINDEIQFHLDMRIAEARGAGLTDDAARAAALRRFGQVDSVEAELLRLNRTRDKRRHRTVWLSDVWQDVRFAIRSLRRAPAFTIAAVATLAIAIGANAAIYSVVHALLLAPLAFSQPQQLATTVNWGWSSGELLALRERLRSASDVAGYGAWSANIDDGSRADRLDGASVTANFFSLLGSAPLLGRGFAPNESDPGRNRVVVLSEGLWRSRFGADTSVIGRRVVIDGDAATVVGVMPATFTFPSSTTAFWKPFVIDHASAVSLWASAGHHFIIRLRPHVTAAAARRELLALVPSLRHANTIWDPGADYGKNANLEGLQEELVGGARSGLLLLLACAGVVLLIACANVANLSLTRATARERELAVRAALGGGRGRLIRQLLTESVVVAAVGGALGLLIAVASLRWTVSVLPAGVPRVTEISVNGAALVFTAALSIVTGIVFGVLPAFRATGKSAHGETARSGRTGRSSGHQRVSACLVVAEVALAVVLGVGAELLVKSFGDLRQLDPGFATSQILTARITPPSATYGKGDRADDFYETLRARLSAMPGVASVAGTTGLPLAKPSFGMGARIEGQYEDVRHGLPTIDHTSNVTPRYMNTVGMRIVAGRAFTDADRDGAEPVAIVSQSMAQHFWPSENPIGKRIGYPYESPWITVVGVVADVKADSLRDPATIAAYFPFAQRNRALGLSPELTIVARVNGDASAVERALRGLVASIDRTVPVSDVRTFDDVVTQSVAKPRFMMLLVSTFAMVALVLGAVGIYGVMSYVVSQRAQELSIRAALGATAGDILLSVMHRAAFLAGTGAAAGAGIAVVAVRPLRASLYGVSPSDPQVYAVVALTFVGVALAASAGPARRAARANPSGALRAD